MLRSEIERAIVDAKAIMQRHHFLLPAFAHYSLSEWQALDIDRESEIIDAKPYAEKIMLVKERQVTPMHYHWQKMEDIINRGGGNLIVKLYARDSETDELDMLNSVSVKVDAKVVTLEPGSEVRLQPGQSICLTQCVYHSFWAEDGCGDVLAGEVSMANDDSNDNRFLQPLGRFSDIEEDEPPQHLLCNEYNKFIG